MSVSLSGETLLSRNFYQPQAFVGVAFYYLGKFLIINC